MPAIRVRPFGLNGGLAEIIVLAGRVVGGGDLVLDVLRNRDIVLGAARLVLDTTMLNAADSLVMAAKDQSIALTATESRH